MSIFTNNGTATNPAITNTNDNNTGIFYPAADTVAISTNGSELLKFGPGGVVSDPGKGYYNGLQVFNLTVLSGIVSTSIILTISEYSFAKVEAYQIITVNGSNQMYSGFFGMREVTPNTLWINQNGATATWGDYINSKRTLTFTIPHIPGSGNTTRFFTVLGRGISDWRVV